jgi:hypothetical protein
MSELAFSLVSFICNLLSVLGSTVVLSAYHIARTKSKPKAAQLIYYLAIIDLIWNSASLLVASFWLFNKNSYSPPAVCYLTIPVISFARIASLIWTCAISIDVFRSVNWRKWLNKEAEERWKYYSQSYLLVMTIFALPSCIVTIIKLSRNSEFGCSPSYETLGNWVQVILTEILPILLGFFCNLIVYLCVHEKMSKKAFPQSVRKRRRRVMYYYNLTCILCWTPTIVLMFYYLIDPKPKFPYQQPVELFTRAALNLGGFFNAIVFGMSNPHLKRPMEILMYNLGLSSLFGIDPKTNLLAHSVDGDKTVLFVGSIASNDEIKRSKYDMYRHMSLSSEDKMKLYRSRPDLDPRRSIRDLNEALLPSNKKSNSHTESIEKKSSASGSRLDSTTSTITVTSNSDVYIRLMKAYNANESRRSSLNEDTIFKDVESPHQSHSISSNRSESDDEEKSFLLSQDLHELPSSPRPDEDELTNASTVNNQIIHTPTRTFSNFAFSKIILDEEEKMDHSVSDAVPISEGNDISSLDESEREMMANVRDSLMLSCIRNDRHSRNDDSSSSDDDDDEDFELKYYSNGY